MVQLQNTRYSVWKIACIFTSILHFANGEPNIICFYGTTDDFVKTSCEDLPTILGTKYLDPNLLTTFYSYGFTGELDNNTEAILSSFLSQNLGNVCLLDWPIGANTGLTPILKPLGVKNIGGNYAIVAATAIEFGKRIGKAIYKLLPAGFKLALLKFIGHSLGCHLWGEAARTIIELTGGTKVACIICLDAASLLFQGILALIKALQKEDADLVVHLHMDWLRYGNKECRGHIDFWANYAYYEKYKVQPGCDPNAVFLTPDSYCSHRLPWNIIVESSQRPYSVKATSANSIEEWMQGIQGLVNYFGTNTVDPTATGSFYFCTNSSSPYGKGDDGVKPELCCA